MGRHYRSHSFSHVTDVFVQLLNRVRLFVIPWNMPGFPVLHYLPLLKHMSIDLVMPSNYLIPFFSCPKSLPAWGSFPMSQLFVSGGQSIGASASAPALPMNIHGWFPLGLSGLISLLTKGLLSPLQHHSLKGAILQCSAFFMAQLLHQYMTTGKTIALTILNFAGKVMSLLFNLHHFIL